MGFDPIRHMLAGIAYRFHAAVVDAPTTFRDFDPGSGVRSPRSLVTHIIQVLRLARSTFEPGLDTDLAIHEHWTWDEMIADVHEELRRLDRHIEHGTQTFGDWSLPQLVHGPFSDTLTHIGQLTMLRRLEGSPVERQSYIRARVEIGRLGMDQPAPAPPLL